MVIQPNQNVWRQHAGRQARAVAIQADETNAPLRGILTGLALVVPVWAALAASFWSVI